MIWYLLFFLRGTTKPPVLDQKHLLRSIFSRYGYNAARHPVLTLMISVAAAAILVYPFPFLYTNNFTNGASNMPHHVWTAAQPYEGKAEADVVMRTIWVHGSYMKALEPRVLLGALDIQNELLGSTENFDPRRAHDADPVEVPDTDFSTDIRDSFHAINGLTNSSWFYHSPLQYWGGSRYAILEDTDIIHTVNVKARQATSVNVTLRHSIVFSGKRFEDHRLVAADALVITLIHMIDSPVAKQWERKLAAIAHSTQKTWEIYHADDTILDSTLYDFRFQPLSLQDDVFLGFAYGVACLYFLITLSKLRALKSRLGLIVAVVTQILVSIVSSFTICAVLKIDLSRIPREAYPLVILTVGLENIFRYINAVILTPSTSSAAARMGDALGTTGYIALVSAVQNLAILWLLSLYVSPQIHAFCSFAAIALTLDFFYLITFFTGVLSIELRRTELSDALQKAAVRGRRGSIPQHETKRTWTDSLLQGDAPFSTRIAGTVVMVGFVLVAQWHFFDNESFGRTGSRFVRFLGSRPQPKYAANVNTLSVDINQARSPTAWLKLQDHETAHEVIKVIKPHAKSYVARVYRPVLFVLEGSDRTPTDMGIRRFLPAAYDFMRHQPTPFFCCVLLCMSAVTLLMNYLLWDDLPDTYDEDDKADDEELITTKSLSKGHNLDVALLTASQDGVIVSVGLDRWIRVWDIRKGIYSYLVHDPDSDYQPFPVLSMTIDDDSNWLAILSAHGYVYLWNIPERRWGAAIEVDVRGRKPLGFWFGYDDLDLVNPLLIIKSNGMLTQVHVNSEEDRNTQDINICRSPLVCVQQQFERIPSKSDILPRLITASKKGCIHIATQVGDDWVSKGVDLPDITENPVISVSALPMISSFLAIRNRAVDLVDIDTQKIVHTFFTNVVKKDTLRCFHSSRRRPECGNIGLASFALSYTDDTTGSCVLQTYFPARENDTLCFRKPSAPGSRTCCLWTDAIESKHIIENPGTWESLQAGYVVGVRQNKILQPESEDETPSPLRRRGGFQNVSSTDRKSNVEWEIWGISARGEHFTKPLYDHADAQEHLLISEPGSIVTVGTRSVAVSLGNMIKVITIGNEKFDGHDMSEDDTAFVGMKASHIRKKKVNIVRKRN